jgi:hypothetical protein
MLAGFVGLDFHSCLPSATTMIRTSQSDYSDGGRMRLALVSYFDIGASFGLADDVFGGQTSPVPDIGEVGVSNPLGEGIQLELRDTHISELWREEALRQSIRQEMELGWNDERRIGKQDFEVQVRRYIAHVELVSCALTIHAIGTAVVWLEFDGLVEPAYVSGVLACFEFAGYRPAISHELHRLGWDAAVEAAGDGGSGMLELSARELAADQVSASGYEESRMFRFFTGLAICLEDEDEPLVRELIDELCTDPTPIEFEFHGDVHYSDGACVIVGRSILPRAREPSSIDRRVEIERIATDIRIAHAFLGTCEAFSRLFVNEIHHQVNGFVNRASGGRTAQELNRLRTLALAVVTLTDFNLVSPTPEDLGYFHRFGEDAQLERLHRSVLSACEILYNVQDSETHRDEERREQVLNRAVVLLAAFTLVSVSVDAYGYVRDIDPLIQARLARVVILLQVLVVLALVTVLFVRRTMPVAYRRRSDHHRR